MSEGEEIIDISGGEKGVLKGQPNRLTGFLLIRRGNLSMESPFGHFPVEEEENAS